MKIITFFKSLLAEDVCEWRIIDISSLTHQIGCKDLYTNIQPCAITYCPWCGKKVKEV